MTHRSTSSRRHQLPQAEDVGPDATRTLRVDRNAELAALLERQTRTFQFEK